jgi:PIN domain nuclease of toxin-antitoxin system
VILDSHAWVYYATGVSIARRSLRQIEAARTAGRLQIAAITLWEIALLESERRLRFTQPLGEWFRDAIVGTGVAVVPLDEGIAVQAARLVRALREPADCQIAATALCAGAPLATRDMRIIEKAEPLGLSIVEL